MIFYFSGTGNSFHVAKQLAQQLDCEMIDMAVDRKKSQEFHLRENEPVGFVFPVYFYTLNHVVFDFIQNLNLEGNGYTFAVITCGGSIGGTGAYLKSELKKKGIPLDHVYSLKMPDNAIFYYDVCNQEQASESLIVAEQNLKEIMTRIEKKEVGGRSSKLWVAKVMRTIYQRSTSTKKFFVLPECIHCGKCEKHCPEQAIHIRDGIPTWEKPNCVMCSACINRCPVKAIQYGKRTKKRNRYVHPDYNAK